jgi:hypothetical protein
VAELGPHSTDLQRAKVLERSNALLRKIEAWISIQHLYIPAIASLRARVDQAGGGKPVAPQDIKLYLPSELPCSIVCPRQFLEYEFSLRYSQAEVTLNDLRGFLLLRSHLWKSKRLYSRGQRDNTRSQALVDNVQKKINFTASRYRHIQKGMTVLSENLLDWKWKNVLKDLDDKDLVGLTSMDEAGSEGRKKLSWIWRVHGTGANADECTEAGESDG